MPKLIGKECCCRLHPAILTSALIDAPPRIKSYFKEYGGLMLLPPLVTLAVGLLAAWVLSGFARE
jgi:hypothetical protein